MNQFAQRIQDQKYAHTKPDGSKETWDEIAMRVTTAVLGAIEINPGDEAHTKVYDLIRNRQFVPGGRYLYASGRPLHQVQNCLLLRAEDSREGWAELLYKSAMALMTGAGIGVVYSDVRAEGAIINRTGGHATGPLALMEMLNEVGRGIMQGGSRRSAIWAGLHWNHPDCLKFIRLKNWSDEVKAAKAKDYNAKAPMDGTNISVILDDDFFAAYEDPSHKDYARARGIYWDVVRQMCETGEPGFSIDTGANVKENLRNACTEVSSEDDSDICNLGSINMARMDSEADMRNAVFYGTLFLLAGTVYSDLPYAKVNETRVKNRRLGLGLMGLHEWLLKRGKAYAQDEELAKYMEIYQTSTQIAGDFAMGLNITKPVKTRAIAPTGTIGIITGTTTGVEPIFCVAFQRRYLNGREVRFEYVIDPTAKRLIDQGLVSPDDVEDAYSIKPSQRVAFQAWLQQYVDHGISSTINLPPWGSQSNNENTVPAFGTMLMLYLPQLRGITAYPDGSRGGQPLTRVSYAEAMDKVGQVFIEGQDICDWSKGGGSCGT